MPLIMQVLFADSFFGNAPDKKLLKNPCNSKINKSGETILINKIYEPYKL
jgi:hypothetical protein